MNTLFLIGPGGVGKSTVGALLAQAMSYPFIDLDVCPEIVASNRLLVRQSGYSILLLPSEDIDIATRIVVARQLMRGFGLVREKEEMKFRQRFREYCALDDCRVVSSERVAERVREKVAAEQRKQKSLAAMRELSELSQKLGLYN